MKIIMLGKLRSGKSTATTLVIEAVKEELGIELTRRPLAAPIYAGAKDFYKRHDLIWRKNRRLMEGIGEALNEDYPGGDKILELYEEGYDVEQPIIVEDCRRLTQANYFAEKDAIFIRIHADKEVRKARCKPGEWSEGHITDTELDGYPQNFWVDNNSNDIGHLTNQLKKIVSEIKKGL